MALTTETQTKLTDHTQSLGSPRKRTIEADILFDKSIVARPLNAPEVASIRVKNTEYYYRWVNRLHSNGRVYMERKAMGFVNATSDDVEVLVGDTVSSKDEIRCGDVILMKIPFHEWASHVKRNMVVAGKLQALRGVHNKEEELSSDVFAGKDSGIASGDDLDTISRTLKGKVTSFTPPNPDAIIEGQKAEDTEKAREAVADIRKRVAADRSK
jgi:hypothetical protein